MKPVILFPTDFSKCAENALQFLIPIAKKWDAQIQVVHGIGSPAVTMPEKTALNIFEKLESEKQKATEGLNKVKKILDENNLKNSSEVIQGMVLQSLSEYAEKLRPELIVMGTVGNHAVGNKLMGSLTYKLIKATNCPVLAIPNKVDFRGFNRITYATNFLSDDLQHVLLLQQLLSNPDSTIDIVHVIHAESPTGEQQQQLNNFKEEILQSNHQGDFQFSLLPGPVAAERLLILTKEKNPDVLALSNSKRKFWDRLFDKSVTKSMIDQADLPLLVFTSSSG